MDRAELVSIALTPGTEQSSHRIGARDRLGPGGGRIAAHEIMIGTPAIRNLIREGKIAQMYSAIQTGQGQGMQTLDQCLQELVAKGVVSREEAKYKAQNKDSI